MECNNVVLVGRLTKDPEVKEAGSSVVTKLGIALNRNWKNDKDEWQQKTTFVDVEAWGKTGEIAAEFLKKGAVALVQGRLEMDEWEGTDGKKVKKLKVVADRISRETGKHSEDSASGESSSASSETSSTTPPPAKKPAGKRWSTPS